MAGIAVSSRHIFNVISGGLVNFNKGHKHVCVHMHMHMFYIKQ